MSATTDGPDAGGEPLDWPATAEALMRARFDAFARHDAAFLIATWHASTRPDALDLKEVRWLDLRILDTQAGGVFDTEGVVEFEAKYEYRGERGVQRERSTFRREDGRWYYVSGDIR